MPTKITYTNYHYDLASVDPALPRSQELIVSENPLEVLSFFYQKGMRVNTYKDTDLEHFGSTSKMNGKTFITHVSIEESTQKSKATLDNAVFAHMQTQKRIKGKKHDDLAKQLYERFKSKDQKAVDFLVNDHQAQIFQEVSDALGVSYSPTQLESYLKSGEFHILDRSHKVLGDIDVREVVIKKTEPVHRSYEDNDFEGGVVVETDNYIVGPEGDEVEDIIVGSSE